MDVTPDKNIQHFSEVFEWNDTMAEVRAALEGLSPRDKDIILMRYFQNQTQREVSAALDISQSYISRIEKKILKKIKKTIESNQAKAERNEEKMARGIAPANKKEVIHLLKTTTMSYKEINEKTGVPYSTIATYAQKHRPKEVRKEKMTNHPGMVREHSGDTDKAVQLLAEGKYTYAEISKQTGVPTGSLTRLRRLYEKGDYKWVNEPKKRVEIEVPVETPVINHPAFMGEKDKERLVEQVPVVKHEVEQVEIKKPEQPVVNMAEAIEEFKAEIKAELRAEVEAEVRKEMAAESVATETSPMGKIQKLLTFKYHASGGNVPTEDFVAEMKELISMLEESNNGSITFTLNVEAE
jgi:DNA-directed RNA polymerase specialized sigma24 family protein